MQVSYAARVTASAQVFLSTHYRSNEVMLSLGFFFSISCPARLELGQRAAVQSPLLMALSTLASAVIRDPSQGDIVGR